LELTFVAEKPPPSHVFEQVALMAAEDIGLGNKVLPLPLRAETNPR
jgi:hypothetical protein